MIPSELIKLIVRLTNLKLGNDSMRATTIGEILKFFGIWVLSTRFEFGSCASLWSNTTSSKYLPAPDFGKTGISRNRFDHIWQHIRFSDQQDTRPEGISSERFQ